MRMIEIATKYAANGFSVVPVLAGHKAPGARGRFLKGWQQFCERQATPGEMAKWWPSQADGISIACGWNGVLAVDVDDDRAAGPVREVLGGRYGPVKRGKKGATAFFRDPSRSIAAKKFIGARPNGKPGEPIVEILAHGNCTVIPPTVHPDTGRPYVWLRGDLLEVLPRDLPLITPADIEALAGVLAPLMPVKRPELEASTVQVRQIADLYETERRRYEGLARRAFERAIGELSTMQDGRFNGVFRAACTLGRWVHAGFIGEDTVRAAIMQASRDNGLVEKRGDHPSIIGGQITRGLERSKGDGLPDLDKMGNRPEWRAAA
jgi:hypothetical protein